MLVEHEFTVNWTLECYLLSDGWEEDINVILVEQVYIGWDPSQSIIMYGLISSQIPLLYQTFAYPISLNGGTLSPSHFYQCMNVELDIYE